MEWNVIFDPDFRMWFYEQDPGLQDEIFAIIRVLAEFGPKLGRPRVDTLKGSVFNIKVSLGEFCLPLTLSDKLFCSLEATNLGINDGTKKIYH
jgi:Phage derived protein Gp49-like (DUF891)